jgi:hypothetical protein
MTTLLLVALMFRGRVVTQGGAADARCRRTPKTLPDTPQGKHVKAKIDAFNTGDEKVPGRAGSFDGGRGLARRPAPERAKMFNGCGGLRHAHRQAAASAPTDPRRHGEQDGDDAIFSFEFEAKAP